MTSTDRSDLQCPLKEKLEWVTPKISLMGSKLTESGIHGAFYEDNLQQYQAPPS